MLHQVIKKTKVAPFFETQCSYTKEASTQLVTGMMTDREVKCHCIVVRGSCRWLRNASV